jgi:hypothetical protein
MSTIFSIMEKQSMIWYLAKSIQAVSEINFFHGICDCPNGF